MASSFTTNFGFEEMATGEQSGTWGTTTNFNFDILDRIASYKAVAITTNADTATLTVREASPGEATENLQDGMYRAVKFTGALDSNCTVTIAPNTTTAWFIIENATTDSGSSGPYSIILSQGSGANVTVQNGKNVIVYCDGAGSGAAVTDALADLQIGTLECTGAAAIDGQTTFSSTVLGGADDAGVDVKLHGDTASRYWLWDTSEDGVVQRGTLTVGVDDTGHDVKFFGATSGSYWQWDESADGVTQVGTLTVGVDDAGHDVKFFGATSGRYMLWDESADSLLFPDNTKVVVGTSSDGYLTHDGSHTILVDNGTGNLTLKSNGAGINFLKGDSETMCAMETDGAVTLYHNNVAKVATASAGVNMTGTVPTLTIHDDSATTYTDGNDAAIIDFKIRSSDPRTGASISMFNNSTNGTDMGLTVDTLVADSAVETLKLHSGCVLMPKQPAFFAYNSTARGNVTGNAVTYTVLFDTEVFDQGADFASNTFTAPVTGRYFLQGQVSTDAQTTTNTDGILALVTSNRTLNVYYNPGNMEGSASSGQCSISISGIFDMDASDTAYVTIQIYQGTQVIGVAATSTFFTGALIA